MNTIIWKGVPSTRIDGLLICDLPPISKPPLRVKETTIDGRDGSIIEDLGYDPYTKSITIALRGNFLINQVIKYFTGEGEIIFSNEPDKVYAAKVISQIDYNRLLRYRTAVVQFRVQPFKHKYLEAYKETPTEAITGTSIVVTKKEDDILKSFSIYGKTTQDGTPTPDTPVEMVSVGAGGSVAVSVTDGDGNTQTVAVQTPNGLRGVPVSSGGNYTDANGQQWICDEIDLARGMYIQRVWKCIYTGNEGWTISSVQNNSFVSAGLIRYDAVSPEYPRAGVLDVLASHCLYAGANRYDEASGMSVWVAVDGNNRYLPVRIAVGIETVDELKAWLAEQNASGTPVTVLYVLETPNKIELTEEEIAAFKSLKLNEPTTTIMNDAYAYMKLEYFKPFEVFNEGLENSKPIMVLRGSGIVGISVNGVLTFTYTFPDGENEVVIDSEKEDAYLGEVLKNRNMNGDFPTLLAGTNKIEWSGNVESIEILPRSRWL